MKKETAMNHKDDQETKTANPTGVEARLARHGGLSYLHIPAVDVHQSATFYEQVEAQGGEIVKAPYPEGNLWVATFRDPAGNVLGLWQEGPR